MLENNQKKCSKCHEVKYFSEFRKRKEMKYGLRSECKVCDDERKKHYRRTKNGLVAKIYGSQRACSKRRGHDYPAYTREELREWLFSLPRFHVLYDDWKRLNFEKMYAPSVDRKDDYLGYAMDNITLMTWAENNNKHHKDRKNGINNKVSKAVLQFKKNGEFVSEFYSTKEAYRQTGISQGNLSACCRGDADSASGFIWKYKQ